MQQTYWVTVDGVRRSYPAGTTLEAIVRDVAPADPHAILLVEHNGKLCELGKPLDRDCTLKLLTIQDRPGMQAYERSAIFLMLKAFYDVLGRDRIQRISVEYSLSHALFVLASGSFRLDQALLDRLEGVPDEKRTARFVCAIAAALPDGTTEVVRGTMEGIIGHEIAGENGFGYDPIFFLPEYGCTSAELSPEKKNELSHRGEGLRKMREILERRKGL